MTAERVPVNCGDALTIANAANLHAELKKALETSSSIELVADAVEKVDTAGLQLIMSLSNELEKSDGTISWKNPSEMMVQSITTLGLTSYLSID